MQLRHLVLALGSLAATASAQWYVSPSGNNANSGTSAASPFQTINHAASVAAAGGVIYLAAGTYGDEQGVISLGSKNLSFVGAGIGASVIRAHSTLTTSLPTGSLGSPTPAAHATVWLVDGSATVNLRDVTLDGNFRVPASGRAMGAYFRNGADGTLENVAIVNVRANPLDSGTGTAGIWVRGDGVANPCLVQFVNGSVAECGKSCAAVFFSADFTATGSSFTGAGPTAAVAQVGVQIGYGASGELNGCTVTGFNYTGGSSTGSPGFLGYDAAAVDLINTTFSSCEVGIGFTGSVLPASCPGVVSRCTVTGAEDAIFLDRIGGQALSGSYFGCALATDAPVYDDGAGNSWTNNGYSNYSGTGPYVIPGGAAADTTPAPAGLPTLGTAQNFLLPSTGQVDLYVGNLDSTGGSDFVTVENGASPSLTVGLNNGAGYTLSTVTFGNANGTAVAMTTGEFNGATGRDVAVVTKSVTPGAGEEKVYVFANNGTGGLSLIATHTLGTAPILGPSARSGAAMTYDSTRQRVVLFGGVSSSGLLNDTWEWNGTAWTQRSPATSPSARSDAEMTFDSGRNVAVLVGGTTAAGAAMDTWEWNGTNWSLRSPATTPPVRTGYDISYCAAGAKTFLFGGQTPFALLNDTWYWDGTNWVLQSPATSPTVRSNHAMAHDPGNLRVVLFGGISSGFKNDTWTWNGTTWTQQSPATSPLARAYHRMVPQAPGIGGSSTNQVLMFGGLGFPFAFQNDTWLWSGSNWVQSTVGTAPTARIGHAMATDTTRNKVVMFGGSTASGAYLSETSEWDADNGWVSGRKILVPSGIAAGDLNADGRDDLVVTDAGTGALKGAAQVLRNGTSGTVWTASNLAGNFTAGAAGSTVGDFNADGFADIAVAEGSATLGNVHVFAGNAGGTWTTGPVPQAVEKNPARILSADLDLDGDLDLLLTAWRDGLGLDPGALAVGLNSSGAFTFSSSSVDRSPTALAIGDLDNDSDPDTSRLDVAVASPLGTSVTVLGSYVEDTGFTSGGLAVVGANPVGVGMGDHDNDGVTDLYYADATAGRVSVLLSNKPAARADSYGEGCVGFGARIPRLAAVGSPLAAVQPNPTFGLSVANGRPFAVTVFVLGTAPTATVASCSLLVSGIGPTAVAVNNTVGSCTSPLPIPASPNLSGFAIYAQAGVLDAAAVNPTLPGVALTNALKIRIGL